MATSATKDWEIVLSSELEGDPSSVQAILADWGMDQATISRMLSEHAAARTPGQSLPGEATSAQMLVSHAEGMNKTAGAARTGLLRIDRPCKPAQLIQETRNHARNNIKSG